MVLRTIAAAVWLAVNAPRAPGQGARGSVLDSASRQPILGAVVMLLDAKRTTLARVITGPRGTFDLGPPGAVRLRVVRLGFRPREVELAGTTPIEVLMPALSMLLEPVQVDDSSGCPRRPDNLAAFSLWDQAKAGLLAAVIARQTLPATMMNLTYKRTIEGNSDRFNDQEVRIHRGHARSSFRALPSIGELLRTGFMRSTVEGDIYFGPDADILLDERFMRNYCLSMASPDKSRPNEAGVSFSPAQRRRDRVDINGTIWIDTVHRSLQRIAFRYVGLDPATDRFRPGGELSFHEVRSGVPQIQRWSFRTVADKSTTVNAAVSRTSSAGVVGRYQVHEEGGELARAEWTDGIAWRAPLGTARVRAKNKDGSPAIGVAASLEGTDYTATTDSTGTAELTDLLPGPYRVVVIDSALAIVGATGSTPMRFVAARDSITELSLVVPSASEPVEAACRKEGLWTPGSYALVVRVVNPDGTPVAGAHWSVSTGRTTGVTGSNGVFQYCFGLDVGTIVQIRVSRNGETPTVVTRTLSRKLTAVRFELPR